MLINFPKKQRVFVTGSLWSLFIYLLYSDEKDIKRTHYFFVDTGIHESVSNNFRCHILPTVKWAKIPWGIRRSLQPFIRLYYIIRHPYLIFADVYGIDQGTFCHAIIGWHKYTLIEDGIGDYYVDTRVVQRKYEYLKRIIFGKIEGHERGHNSQCIKMILTQPPTNDDMRRLGEQISLIHLWEHSSESKQCLILSKFNILPNDLELLSSRNIILLTQPISEDGFVTEKKKIEIYRTLLEGIDEKKLIIKIHPRERTHYQRYFKDALVFDKRVPMQIFEILGLKYKKAITISSTAVTSFAGSAEIVFAGNEIHPEILKHYGHIEL